MGKLWAWVKPYKKEIHSITDYKARFLHFIQLRDHFMRMKQDGDQKQLRETAAKVVTMREELNGRMPKIEPLLFRAGIRDSLNLRYLDEDTLPKKKAAQSRALLDRLEQTKGWYENEQEKLRWKLLNPLFYMGLPIRSLFFVLTWAGFDGTAIELSLFGKIWKAFWALAVPLSVLLGLLSWAGINLQTITTFFQNR